MKLEEIEHAMVLKEELENLTRAMQHCESYSGANVVVQLGRDARSLSLPAETMRDIIDDRRQQVITDLLKLGVTLA